MASQNIGQGQRGYTCLTHGQIAMCQRCAIIHNATIQHEVGGRYCLNGKMFILSLRMALYWQLSAIPTLWWMGPPYRNIVFHFKWIETGNLTDLRASWGLARLDIDRVWLNCLCCVNLLMLPPGYQGIHGLHHADCDQGKDTSDIVGHDVARWSGHISQGGTDPGRAGTWAWRKNEWHLCLIHLTRWACFWWKFPE